MSGWQPEPARPAPEWVFQIEVARRRPGRFGGPPTLDFDPPRKRLATRAPTVRYRPKHNDWLVRFCHAGLWTMAVPDRDVPARPEDLVRVMWGWQPEIVRVEPGGMARWRRETEAAARLILAARAKRRAQALEAG
ncbi:MAG: hypothetical protein E6Q97_19420 [Desulfurellales bacterium]|nr:MAG: hypothetical protein E6Q97_19420 [Desulfurellales bacterium]